jgi:hypothetical protein
VRCLGLLLCVACAPAADGDRKGAAEEAPSTAPWSGGLPALGEVQHPRLQRSRAIVHLHSPWSHDACDGHGYEDGVVDADCLDDLRRALCATRVDVAFLTDHPAHAAEIDWDELWYPHLGDEPIEVDGVQVGAEVLCEDGHRVSWLPGSEDELMPVALNRHVAETPEDRDRLYNASDAEAFQAMREAGAVVLVAHSEGRERSQLEAYRDDGLVGMEIFNLHAMFAPDKRVDDLGLEAFDWLTTIAPFTDDSDTAEPDLLFLGVLLAQTPSLEHWDALLATGPMVGVAGTDAHQNVLPYDLRDGERGDSYRRMLRWFSNHLLVEAPGAEAAEQALAAGRVYVAFEALGTPANFDVHVVQDDGRVVEMGGEASGGTLVVGCPRLAEGSPRGTKDPEITVEVVRDGMSWAQGCGEFPLDGSGAYRVRVDQVPHHLEPFLGLDPEPWLQRPYPWLFSGAIRVP